MENKCLFQQTMEFQSLLTKTTLNSAIHNQQSYGLQCWPLRKIVEDRSFNMKNICFDQNTQEKERNLKNQKMY